jgi:4a-hydroxytetrahydrobiopterin dehydratase
MKILAQMQCIPCRGGQPPLSNDEITELMLQIPEWTLREQEGIKRLERQFKFSNFAQALAFTVELGSMAEAEDHHPAILTEWGKVTVTWWTHVIKGLHRNDFILASRTDNLYQTTA